MHNLALAAVMILLAIFCFGQAMGAGPTFIMVILVLLGIASAVAAVVMISKGGSKFREFPLET